MTLARSYGQVMVRYNSDREFLTTIIPHTQDHVPSSGHGQFLRLAFFAYPWDLPLFFLSSSSSSPTTLATYPSSFLLFLFCSVFPFFLLLLDHWWGQCLSSLILSIAYCLLPDTMDIAYCLLPIACCHLVRLSQENYVGNGAWDRTKTWELSLGQNKNILSQ